MLRAFLPVTLGLVLAGCGAVPPVPSELGGLALAHSTRGAEALTEIGRLHGKSIAAGDAFVAHYERDGAVAMLYVSSAWVGPIARRQMSRMVDGIERGRANAEGHFFHLKRREHDGVTLYSTLGLGQIHYFYRRGATVVWLAADPAVAQRALADTLRVVR
jgi:hypothetical protein